MKIAVATKITTLVAVVLTILKIVGIGTLATFKWTWIILIWLSPLALCLFAFLVHLIILLEIKIINKIR
jgi:hypothetical protein